MMNGRIVAVVMLALVIFLFAVIVDFAESTFSIN